VSGRFLPCRDGATEIGRKAELGFSCFALKTSYTIGLWKDMGVGEQSSWIEHIRSFQRSRDPGGSTEGRDAFIDLPVLDALPHHRPGLLQRVFSRGRCAGGLSRRDLAVIGETKQAIATLAQVGARPATPYRGFPQTADAVTRRLRGFDWSAPWGAGGQTAALVTLIRAQAGPLAAEVDVGEMLNRCRSFFAEIADAETGAYFVGERPGHDHLVNGAMKVLTGLDWLDEPIHFPERLIDTTLAERPRPEGCHLVDAIYVLHRCAVQSEHRRKEVRDYSAAVLDMIRAHQRGDGGFSYSSDRAQTSYYGAPISEGRCEGDIHGTCLLSWALAMILENLEEDVDGWEVIRP
jgi:hypothetical protein